MGFEAAKIVLNYGFSELGLDEVVGLTAEKNLGSIKILETLGFKRNFYSTRRKHSSIVIQEIHDNLLKPST